MAALLGWGEPKVGESTAAHADAAHILLNAWVTDVPISGMRVLSLSKRFSLFLSFSFRLSLFPLTPPTYWLAKSVDRAEYPKVGSLSDV